MVKITNKEYALLSCLKKTIYHNTIEKKYVINYQYLMTQSEINKKYKISSGTISQTIKKYPEFFYSTTKNHKDILFGLSQKGLQIYHEEYVKREQESDMQKIVNDTKKEINFFINKSKDDFYKLTNKEINRIYDLFVMSFIGNEEFPFEIKIKLKKKYSKNPKKVYGLLMSEKFYKK